MITAPPTLDARGATVPLGRIAGWGRSPVVEGREIVSEDLVRSTRFASLTRGLGRSYGDASLPSSSERLVAGSRLADRILAFDPSTGLLRAEAGLSLHALNRLLLTRGWFTPVTPGTQFVTLGGMVAADVHGKNHHSAGTFGRHLEALRLRTGSGEILDVGADSEPELFRATQGGMGLTGHILEVAVRMQRVPSPWILAGVETAPDIETLVERLRAAGREWPYTVAWADFLRDDGRGILVKGRWATPDEAGIRAFEWPGSVGVPFDMPNWVLGGPLMRVFNRAYYLANGIDARTAIVHPQPFFYPLDAVRDWNRVYGRRGMTQYQCVLPSACGAEAFRTLIRIARSHDSSPYLVVVKDFGVEGEGLLSFPRPGITFTMDYPVSERTTQRLVDALNDFVASTGGRIYLAKDAFTRAEHFRAMEPRLAEFAAVRDRWDPERTIRSAQSVRLFGDAA